jgi:hypothetical protein
VESGRPRSVAARARRLLDLALAEITTRRGRLALFGIGILAYAVQSLFMPLEGGRDLGTYLRYYAQMWHDGSALPMSMLVRTPVTPVVAGGLLDVAGGAAAQVVMALCFGIWLVAWVTIASEYGPRVALATAAVLLVYPAYAILFHRLSSDVLFTTAYALWALLLVRSALKPSVARFALVGLGIGVLALIRPGNQTLAIVALVPLVLALAWWRRLAAAAAVVACTAAVLVPYTVYNGVRYDDYTVARGANAVSPFYRAYALLHIVSPENGPASRELARAVERELLPREPYRSYGITLESFFAEGSPRMWEDLVNLSDRVWGWDSDYSKLRAVAFEGIRAHPGTFARGMIDAFLGTLWKPEFYIPDGARRASDGGGSGTETGAGLPEPSGGEPIPSARMGLYSTTPDGSIREVWTSATDHRIVFDDTEQAERFRRMNADVRRLSAELPPYEGNQALITWANRASRWFPRPLVWLLVGAVAAAWRRPQRITIAAGLSLLGLFLTATVGLGNAEYPLPAVPAFVLLATAGLLGTRRQPRPRQSARED